MITIDQLLESVDLEFEPRWVTKDLDGEVSIWEVKPVRRDDYYGLDDDNYGEMDSFGKIKLTEFENKHWTECIYEVPRKTTGKIERLETTEKQRFVMLNKINELVDAVNELKSGSKNVQEQPESGSGNVALEWIKGAKNE